MCGNDYDFEEDSVFTDDGGNAGNAQGGGGHSDMMNLTMTSGRSAGSSHKSASARRRLNYNTLQVSKRFESVAMKFTSLFFTPCVLPSV